MTNIKIKTGSGTDAYLAILTAPGPGLRIVIDEIFLQNRSATPGDVLAALHTFGITIPR
jgi:hypothetical protein